MSESPRKQGWIRRLVGYMAPHKKNAYIAFGVAIGGQLIQSLLPVVQKVVVDDVITRHHDKSGHVIPGKPLRAVAHADDRDGRAHVRVRVLPPLPRRPHRTRRAARPAHRDLPPAPTPRLRATTSSRPGQLVSRASSDVALIQGFLQFMPIGVANILLFIVSLGAMFLLSPLLSLVMLAVAPACCSSPR